MTLYTFQPQAVIDLINTSGIVLTEFIKTNLYKHQREDGAPTYWEAYQRLGRQCG